jgi:hypothetical protein
MRDAKKKGHNKFLAALMLSGVNREKYGKLKRSLGENYVTGTSKYPESPEAVLRILSTYTPPPGWNRRLKQEGGGKDEGAMFVQLEGRDDSWSKNISCHNCRKKGHLKQECPNKKTNKGGEQVHSNIEDNPNEGENRKYLRASQGKGGGEQEFSVTRQPEHGESDCQPKSPKEYLKVKQANHCTLQRWSHQDGP